MQPLFCLGFLKPWLRTNGLTRSADHTIPGYMVGFVCILAFSFIADYLRNKWIVLGIVSGVCTVLFVAVTAADGQMARCKRPRHDSPRF